MGESSSRFSVNFDIGLRDLKALYDLGRIGLAKARTRISTPFRVEKLADDIFSTRINHGSVVTVQGKLTRYSTTYRPVTFGGHIITKASDPELHNWVIDPATGHRKRNISPSVEFSPSQFPVQTHPEFEDENGVWFIAFLYPVGFNGFVLDADKGDKNNRKGDALLIDHNHQPIPVLLSRLAYEQCSEHEVVITGVVTSLPESVLSAFSSNLCSTREAFFYNFLRPFSIRSGFCIDCRDKHNSDISAHDKLQSLLATIYVEGHFEGVSGINCDEQFTSAIPKGLGFHVTFPTAPGKILYPTEDPYISVVKEGVNRFGFYSRTNLVDPSDFEMKLRNLRDFYASFRKHVARDVRKIHSIEAKFKPDFMFDYSRQKSFHPEGVLTSSEANTVLERSPELSEAKDWVSNDQRGR